MADLTGKIIGKVQIVKFIARGGMAEVYLGEHTALNRQVAVKIMRDQLDQDADARSRFEREAKVMAGLRHPNIIQIFDYELNDAKQPCLVMEYAPGASLGGILKELNKRGEKLPLNLVSKILRSLASAVDYAHAQNIVHRDIKPGNVLLRSSIGPIDVSKPLPEDVEPILTDFGLVRLMDSTMHTSVGTVSGTPAYMSPEQARGDIVDKRSDIYSLGVMLYEMLAGDVPFAADSSFGVLMKHINDAPPAIASVSSDVQAVISRALAKDPALRYQSGKELADEYDAIFNGQTISPGTLKISKIAHQTIVERQKSRTNQIWRFAAGAAIVVALALGIRVLTVEPPVAPLPPTAPPTSTPDPTLNEIVGQIRFLDSTSALDLAVIKITRLSVPEPGFHYEAWFLAQGGEVRRRVGVIEFNQSGEGFLEFNSPGGANTLEAFDHAEITIEPDNDPNPEESSGNIVASSILPPASLIHIRHVNVHFESAPEGISLIQGTQQSADILSSNVAELQTALKTGNKKEFTTTLEGIINQVSGSANAENYKDWNNDGETTDPTQGYGLLQNGERGYNDQGYLPQLTSHVKFASGSFDAHENLKIQGELVVLCVENVNGWTKQLLNNALELQQTEFSEEMMPTIDKMIELADLISNGADANGNGTIEPIVGECGVKTAHELAYLLTQMDLYPGADRIMPKAPTPSP